MRLGLKSFEHVVDRNSKIIELYWASKEKDIYEYELYKKKKDGNYILYKVIQYEKERMSFLDSTINPGNIYLYAIRATFIDGTYSNFKEITVTY